MAANPQIKQANRLGLWVRRKLAATVYIHHRIVIITLAIRWYSFYRPTEGGRLSRPTHCSKGEQPVPKAVYRSGCRDKHNRPRCDSIFGPLTPQSTFKVYNNFRETLFTRLMIFYISTEKKINIKLPDEVTVCIKNTKRKLWAAGVHYILHHLFLGFDSTIGLSFMHRPMHGRLTKRGRPLSPAVSAA